MDQVRNMPHQAVDPPLLQVATPILLKCGLLPSDASWSSLTFGANIGSNGTQMNGLTVGPVVWDRYVYSLATVMRPGTEA